MRPKKRKNKKTTAHIGAISYPYSKLQECVVTVLLLTSTPVRGSISKLYHRKYIIQYGCWTSHVQPQLKATTHLSLVYPTNCWLFCCYFDIVMKLTISILCWFKTLSIFILLLLKHYEN